MDIKFIEKYSTILIAISNLDEKVLEKLCNDKALFNNAKVHLKMGDIIDAFGRMGDVNRNRIMLGIANQVNVKLDIDFLYVFSFLYTLCCRFSGLAIMKLFSDKKEQDELVEKWIKRENVIQFFLSLNENQKTVLIEWFNAFRPGEAMKHPDYK